MKIRLILAVGLMIAPVFYGCNRSASDGLLPGDFQPLNVSVGVTTKGPVVGKWLQNLSQINLILLDKGATSSYNVMMPYTLKRSSEADMGVWTPADDAGLIVNHDAASSLAYYPASDAAVSLSSDKRTITPLSSDVIDFGGREVSPNFEVFSMVLDPTQPETKTELITSASDIDYLTGSGNDVSLGTTTNVSIAMRHARAMLVVNLTAEANFTGATNLRSITFQNIATGSNPLKKGSFGLLDNRFVPSSTETTTYVRSMTGFSLGTHYSIMVNPAQITASSVQMVFNIDDKTRYTFNVPPTNWVSGQVYTYNVRLVGNSIVLLGVTVNDWPAVITHNVDFN